MRVGPRVTAAVGTLALLAALGAWHGGARVASVHRASAVMSDRQVPALIDSAKWSAALSESARHMRNILILEQPAQIKLEIAAIYTDREAANALRARVAKADKSPDGVRAYKAALDARAVYLVAEDELLKAADAADYARVKTLLLAHARPAQQAYLDAIGKLIDVQVADVRQQRERVEAEADGSGAWLALWLALAGAAGVGAAGWIMRGLNRQVGGSPGYAAMMMDKLAGGDLSQPIALAPRDRGSLLYAMSDMRQSLLDVVAQVRADGAAIGGAASGAALAVRAVAARAAEQAGALRDAAAAARELDGAARQAAEHALLASQSGAAAAARAAAAAALGARAADAMAAVNGRHAQIAELVDMIDDIVAQIDALALRAGDEAERSGEPGRATALVVGEVRGLAQRATATARAVKGLLGDAQEPAGAGAALADQAASAMGQVALGVRAVDAAATQLLMASQRSRAGAERIGDAIARLDGAARQGAAQLDGIASAAREAHYRAGRLAQLVGLFTLGASRAAPADAGPVGRVRNGAPYGKVTKMHHYKARLRASRGASAAGAP